jgi:hypothetical protein
MIFVNVYYFYTPLPHDCQGLFKMHLSQIRRKPRRDAAGRPHLGDSSAHLIKQKPSCTMPQDVLIRAIHLLLDQTEAPRRDTEGLPFIYRFCLICQSVR